MSIKFIDAVSIKNVFLILSSCIPTSFVSEAVFGSKAGDFGTLKNSGRLEKG
ncbi:MAG: hypothetical protein SH857_13700 [Chitinophagales bacterium]|nr:hypothetical protein [Chitinophagales bacterium]